MRVLACPAALVLALILSAAACADARKVGEDVGEQTGSAPATTESSGPARDPASSAPPEWLGTRALPRTASGYGEVRPTPPELVDRRLWTQDVLPPPPDERFISRVAPVPADVAARSTWTPDCPVPLEALRYVTVAFWGFDGLPHTGELLVHQDVADDITEVFAALHAARFPIESLRITSAADNDAPPTGDGNVSGSFNCRPSRGATGWSEHARGLAVDLNPFHNPYVRGELVLPELASAYIDRSRHRPGMIQPGDAVTRAFAAVGWSWGGDWRSAKDFMHFSATGR